MCRRDREIHRICIQVCVAMHTLGHCAHTIPCFHVMPYQRPIVVVMGALLLFGTLYLGGSS